MNFVDAFFANGGEGDYAEINLQSRVDLTPLLYKPRGQDGN